MDLQRDAIRAMLRAAYDAGTAAADELKHGAARAQVRENWLDRFIGKLGISGPQVHPTPADFVAVSRAEFDKLRSFTLLLVDIYASERQSGVDMRDSRMWALLNQMRDEVLSGK